jgi:hypothetical protein
MQAHARTCTHMHAHNAEQSPLALAYLTFTLGPFSSITRYVLNPLALHYSSRPGASEGKDIPIASVTGLFTAEHKLAKKDKSPGYAEGLFCSRYRCALASFVL